MSCLQQVQLSSCAGVDVGWPHAPVAQRMARWPPKEVVLADPAVGNGRRRTSDDSEGRYLNRDWALDRSIATIRRRTLQCDDYVMSTTLTAAATGRSDVAGGRDLARCPFKPLITGSFVLSRPCSPCPSAP